MQNGTAAIVLNGREHPLEAPLAVELLLASLGLEGRRVAVMVNGEIIRRERRGDTLLTGGEAVEVVHMVGGG